MYLQNDQNIHSLISKPISNKKHLGSNYIFNILDLALKRAKIFNILPHLRHFVSEVLSAKRLQNALTRILSEQFEPTKKGEKIIRFM